MRFHRLPAKEWTQVVGVGVATAVLLSLVMVPANLFGIAPMPQPPSLAFAELVARRELPLLAGLPLHVIWVTFFSVAFVVLWRDRMTFLSALLLGLALWIVVLIFFFPLVGWGSLGLGIGPMLIVGAIVPHLLFPHLLFAIILWGLCRITFDVRQQQSEATGQTRNATRWIRTGQ